MTRAGRFSWQTLGRHQLVQLIPAENKPSDMRYIQTDRHQTALWIADPEESGSFCIKKK
jgi:hypothetical protein